MGYTLQSNASGAPGLRLMAWSHSLAGGKRSAASSLKSRANSLYSSGSCASCCSAPASIARSVATDRTWHSVSSCRTILCFVSSDRLAAMTGCCLVMWGLMDDMMIGRSRSSIIALLQLNLGSKVASHGYPRSISSCPMSVTRNHISLVIPLVCIFKLRKCMIIPDLFEVLSMLKIFFGFGSFCSPNPIRFANAGCMKLSVAPESTNAFLSAMK
jgi:hypothetical protein